MNIEEKLNLSIDIEKLKNNPSTLILTALTLAYLSLILIGLANLVIFGIRKFKNKPIVDIVSERKKFSLSEKGSSKLLFLISLMIFGMYVILIALGNFKLPIPQLPLIFNLAFQVGVILIVLRYISLKSLGFSLSKKHLIISLRIYSAILPVTLISLLINAFIAKKMGIGYSPNPAIEIFFLLKNKILLSTLIIQVVLLGPIAEELFFRGFIYKLTKNKYSFLVSAGLTSIFFSLIHRVPYNILPLFVLSLALCYVYEKTQNILAPFILHFVHNFVSVCFFLAIKELL
ncbi:MAG: CPBP family intramembrane metalloprotease [Omnitrophica bacterium]|nr:CPBP family intramembrane metalloprotease [Candidatus Omnitrophota bacterium]